MVPIQNIYDSEMSGDYPMQIAHSTTLGLELRPSSWMWTTCLRDMPPRRLWIQIMKELEMPLMKNLLLVPLDLLVLVFLLDWHPRRWRDRLPLLRLMDINIKHFILKIDEKLSLLEKKYRIYWYHRLFRV